MKPVPAWEIWRCCWCGSLLDGKGDEFPGGTPHVCMAGPDMMPVEEDPCEWDTEQ